MILKRKYRRISFWSWERDRFLKQDRKMLTIKRKVWDIWLQQRKSVHQKVYKNIREATNVEKAPTMHMTTPVRVQNMYMSESCRSVTQNSPIGKWAKMQNPAHTTAEETRVVDKCEKKLNLTTNQRTTETIIYTHYTSKNVKFDSDMLVTRNLYIEGGCVNWSKHLGI